VRKSIVKAKLAKNEPVLITQLHLTDGSLFEMASLMGFDCLWMDLEHHSYSDETAANLMRAARVGTSDIVARPAKGEFMRMGRLLEAGATGILYPRCSDAEEAREIVKWAKFAPQGKRGFDGSSGDNPYRFMKAGEYIETANRETFIIAQLEEQSAIDQAEEICAVEGIDGLMLGPADFSILSGIPGQVDHEIVTAASETIAKAAANTGKHWGRTSSSFEKTQEYMDMGARLIFQGSDLMGLKGLLQKLKDDAAPLGFTFND
jgi:4-hydroxy-2-oxoheptanedioate aldolase